MTRQCPSCGGFCKKSGCERDDIKGSEMKEIKLPPLPRLQVPRIDADIDLMDIRRLVKWAEDIANTHARAAIEADRQARGEPDTEREKWLASLFPEDRMFEEIDQMARESYKRHHSSTRGQMLVRADSWDSHVVWATKRWIEENAPLPTATQPQQQARQCECQRKAKAVIESEREL